MLTVALLLAAAPGALPTSFTGPRQGLAAADCPSARRHEAGRSPRPMRPQRLTELPPGRLELAVLREIDHCPVSAVLREGVGAGRGR